MLNKINVEQGKKYTFIVESDWLKDLEIGSTILENDVFTKSDAIILNVKGSLIVCSDINKTTGFCKKIVKETYSEYLDIISKHDFKKEQWVYNILDGTAESKSVLFKNDKYTILPNYTWKDKSDLLKMHCLAFATCKKLYTIRDLDGSHIDFLECLKHDALSVIKSNYGFDENIIKMFIHYAPSTYHLHIHFVLISNTDVASSCEYSHELNSVIENLKINHNYYKLITMNKRI